MINPTIDFTGAIDCYLRANCFEKAVELCYNVDSSKVEELVKPALLVTIDLKRN